MPNINPDQSAWFKVSAHFPLNEAKKMGGMLKEWVECVKWVEFDL